MDSTASAKLSFNPHQVSILTQPLGWVQLSVDGFDSFSKTEFQSSSSFNPHPADRLGAAEGYTGQSPESGCFNSHPTSRQGAGGGGHSPALFQFSPNLSAGCSPASSGGWGSTIVKSFQSSPNLSAGCSVWIRARSILTQPLGWVQRSRWLSCFNPHPTSRLGASAEGVVTIGDLVTVSILTQPLGWVQPEGLPHFRYHHISFNPHLTSRLGAAQMLSSRSGTGTCFNPHPTSRLGAVDVEDLLVTDVPVFQSAPNLSVGCSRWPDRSGGDVSILTQHLDWVQLGHVLNRPLVVRVSILTQPIGWVQRAMVRCSGGGESVVSILTQPLGWVQHRVGLMLLLFQSSPNLLAGCSLMVQ